MEKSSVSKATLGRLPGYLDFLRTVSQKGASHISSTAIARKLSLGEVLVRKDLATVSGAGRPRVGYVISELIEEIEKLLGCNAPTPAVLVGAGKLGMALLRYEEFENYGVKILRAFDRDPDVVNRNGEGKIFPMESFGDFCRKEEVHIGIITVGASSAQQVCDLMVENGITAIWNFAPCKLCVPEGVLLQNENLALSLAHLNNQLGFAD